VFVGFDFRRLSKTSFLIARKSLKIFDFGATNTTCLLALIFDGFNRLTHFIRDILIARTSNLVEDYYRQTDPNQIKKIYKTAQGILSYLIHKMKKWIRKHGEYIKP
jgi:hypothetical protein